MLSNQNWAKNINIQPQLMTSPRTVDDVKDAVASASKEKIELRSAGGSWSFTDIMATSGHLIHTRELRGVLAFSQGNNVWSHSIPSESPEQRPRTSQILVKMLRENNRTESMRLAHVLAGTNIRELYLALGSPGGYRNDSGEILYPGDLQPGRGEWMLPTKVGLSGQTIAGAISTATHGGDFNLPPLADYIRAIELVGYDGITYWIERADESALTDREIMTLNAQAGNLTAQVVQYDDELFATAIVAVGSMGVIVSVILEVVPQFGLSETGISTTWRDIRPLLESGEIFTTTRFSQSNLDRKWIDLHPNIPGRIPRGLGLAINPYRLSDNYSANDNLPDREVLFMTQAEAPTFAGNHNWPEPNKLDFAHIVHEFESGDLRGTRVSIGRFLKLWKSLDGTQGQYNRSYTVWDPYKVWHDGEFPTDNLFLSMEIAVSTGDGQHVKCIDRLLEICDEIHYDTQIRRSGVKLAAGIFLRYTMPSKGLLAMQHFPDGERCCHIEILVAKEIDLFANIHSGHHNMENLSEVFMKRFEDCAYKFGGRLHWGQLHHLNRFAVDRDYSKTIDRFRAAVTRIGYQDGGLVFHSDASRRTGLVSNTTSVVAVALDTDNYRCFRIDGLGNVNLGLRKRNGAFVWINLGNRFEDGERFTGPLAAVVLSNGSVGVFGLGLQGGLLYLNVDATRFTPLTWKNLESSFEKHFKLKGQLSAVSVDEFVEEIIDGSFEKSIHNHIDVFGVTLDGDICHYHRSNNGLWENQLIGNGLREGFLVGPVNAVKTTRGKIELYGIEREGRIVKISQVPSGWIWEKLEFPKGHLPKFSGHLAAFATDTGVELFAPGQRRTLYCIKLRQNIEAVERIPGSFPKKSAVYGSRGDFKVNPQDNELFQDLSYEVTEWFTGSISACSFESKLCLFGCGDGGTLLMMARHESSDNHNWEFIDLERFFDPLVQEPFPLVKYIPASLEGPFVGRDLTNQFYRYSIADGANFKQALMDGIDLEGAKLNGATFLSVPLNYARLFGAELQHTNFTGATLNFAELAHTNAIRSQFYGCTANYSDFSATKLSGSNFEGANLSAATLRDADCRSVRFIGTNLSMTRMEGVWLDGSNLEGANLSGALLSKASSKGARFVGCNCSAALLADGDFRGSDFTGANLSVARLDQCRVDGVLFVGANLSAASLVNASSIGANFYGANLSAAIMNGCQAHGASFYGANLSAVSLVNASSYGANFYGANLQSGVLRNGNFRGANFTGADLRNADLRNADFTGAIMTGTKLDGADTTGAQF